MCVFLAIVILSLTSISLCIFHNKGVEQYLLHDSPILTIPSLIITYISIPPLIILTLALTLAPFFSFEHPLSLLLPTRLCPSGTVNGISTPLGRALEPRTSIRQSLSHTATHRAHCSAGRVDGAAQDAAARGREPAGRVCHARCDAAQPSASARGLLLVGGVGVCVGHCVVCVLICWCRVVVCLSFLSVDGCVVCEIGYEVCE